LCRDAAAQGKVGCGGDEAARAIQEKQKKKKASTSRVQAKLKLWHRFTTEMRPTIHTSTARLGHPSGTLFRLESLPNYSTEQGGVF